MRSLPSSEGPKARRSLASMAGAAKVFAPAALGAAERIREAGPRASMESWRVRLGARFPPWIYWPVALVALSATARAYRFRLGPLEVPSFLLQDLAVGLAFGLGLFFLCRRGRLGDQVVLPALGLTLLLWTGLAGMVITGLLAYPVGVKLLLQTPSVMFLETALRAGSVQSSVTKIALFAFSGPLAVLAGALWLRPGWARAFPAARPWLALLVVPLAASPWASFDPRYRDTHPAVTIFSSGLSLALHQNPPDPGIAPERFQAEVSTLSGGTAPLDPRLAGLRWDGQSQYDVLVVVLETGVAPLLDLEHDDARWLPTLRQLARRSLSARRHVSPFPTSTKSIFAVVSSRYPYPDYRNLVLTRPEARLETLAELLQKDGYRTGSYASIVGEYDRMATFLRHHGYAELGDKESLGLTLLNDPTFGSDRELYEAYRRWLTQADGPSFFMLLPSNSHWPFHFPAEDALFPGQENVDLYKNAMQHQDRLLREHLAWLEETGRLERTILVVVADHGSYFDLAGDVGVTLPAGLLEHHVPLLIDHPRLRGGAGVVLDDVSSHVDLGPTLLAMLSDRAPPADWQGLSLLDPQPRRLVFFYQDFADGVLAATDGGWVYSWNRASDQLSRDPWPGVPVGRATAAAEERLKVFFAHQLAVLERVR